MPSGIPPKYAGTTTLVLAVLRGLERLGAFRRRNVLQKLADGQKYRRSISGSIATASGLRWGGSDGCGACRGSSDESRVTTTRLELRQIPLHFRHLPQMGQRFFQDRGRDRIARRKETVVHPPPLAPRGDDARAAEIRQMARDFWLADPQDLHKIADANFLVGDEVEEAKARGIGQSAKEKIERERFFLPGHAQIIYGLTDMSKEAYRTYIRTSVYIICP